ARDSIAQGLNQITSALQFGADAQQLLSKIQELSRDHAQAPDAAEGELREALDAFARRVDAAISQGVSAIAGQSINVQAEPGAAMVSIQGVDLRLGDASGDIFKFSLNATFGSDPSALANGAQRSSEALQSAMARLGEAGRALESHAGFVGAAADVAAGVRGD